MKLYKNALSSLEEGLKCWKQAENGNKDRYQFAIPDLKIFFRRVSGFVQPPG
jgi:hypothetical protein